MVKIYNTMAYALESMRVIIAFVLVRPLSLIRATARTMPP